MTSPGSSSWVSTQLLHWYDINKRDLPWRSTKDPYSIWLSEIIFQQTRIDQGTKYYHSFKENFPDIHSLASSDDELVMKLWEGLGYYNRARNLLFTARYISKELGGVFPDKYSDLLKLKGVGEYTAAAVSSVCYKEVQAAVDGNVLRVLSRFYSDKTAIDSSPAKKYYRMLAQALVDHNEPGDFNQAMMDLGSGVCKPRNPECEICPLATRCSALKEGEQTSYPVKIQKRKVKDRFLNYFVIEISNKVFIRKRDTNDIWPELFEFPLIEGKISNDQLLIDFQEKFRVKISSLPSPQTKVHLLSHQRLTIQIFRIILDEAKEFDLKGFILIDFKNLALKAFPRPLQNLSLR